MTVYDIPLLTHSYGTDPIIMKKTVVWSRRGVFLNIFYFNNTFLQKKKTD